MPAMIATPRPIASTWRAVSIGSGPPMQARDEIGDRDVEKARGRDREHDRQRLLHAGEREVAREARRRASQRPRRG